MSSEYLKSGAGQTLHHAAERVVSMLTQLQKIDLLSGSDMWHTTGLLEHNVPAVMLTDGPHGLRKQTDLEDRVGLGASEPATCFPPAVTLGSTWDVRLLEEVGMAIGREARAEQIGVVLGPGLNLKRHPAGGRNFEYFSEDPLLSGKAAAAMVRGIQAEGVGACPKHLAGNNQESWRMRSDSIIDQRTLRELYLTGFEIAVTEAQPWTVMSSYNLLNGEHTGESRRLLTDILRTEWGFDGVVMSDWYAVADRPAGVAAGLDLEMPSSHGAWDSRVRAALARGSLSDADLDRSCVRIVELALRTVSERRARGGVVNLDEHHELACQAAAAGAVLLTNDGLLPLAGTESLAVIGAFAQAPRYQGAGSSLVEPTRLDTVLGSLQGQLGELISYSPGYDPTSGQSSPELLSQARAAAAVADVAVVVIGLPPDRESEGFDRADLRLPDGMEKLVHVVTSANPRTAVVLMNGSPIEMPWADQPAAVLEAYLGGQAGGSAVADILLGVREPAGRLAESFPVSADELPASANFANHPTQIRYQETCYVGYRFHDSFAVAPRFCFGHGLSYTSFDYGKAKVRGRGTDRTISVEITNTGSRAGAEVVQLYVHPVASAVHRPDQELKAFAKVYLEPGQSSRVELETDERSFAVWDVTDAGWRVEAGAYEVRIGASSRDIRTTATVKIASAQVVHPVAGPASAVATDEEFAELLGGVLPAARPLWPLHEDSAVNDLTQTKSGRRLHHTLVAEITKRLGLTAEDPNTAMVTIAINELPLRGLVVNSGGSFTFAALRALLAVLNRVGKPRQQP